MEEVVDKYNATLVQQLERHAQLALNLTTRLALREAELSVLSGFARSLTEISRGDAALREMLHRCLDAAGASRGVILLREADASFTLETQLGYDETEAAALREIFARSPILARVLERQEPLVLPSRDAPETESRRLLDRMRTDSALIAPIGVAGGPLGALVIGSCARELDDNWNTFLILVASQIGQAVLLIRAVSRLAAAEEKYRRIFDNAAVGIFQSTPEGALLTANGTLARMAGYDSGEELRAAVGTGLAQLYVEPERRIELIRQFESSDVVAGFESLARRKDGRVIWMSETVRAIRDPGGGISMLEGVVEDITVRKRAERATTTLAEIGRKLSESLDLDVIGRLVTETVCKLLDARSAVVYRLDPESGALVVVTASSDEGPALHWTPRLDAGIGLAAIAVRDRRVVASSDVARDPRSTFTPAMLGRFEESTHRALLVIPLLVRDRMFGVLAVSDTTGRAFTEVDIDVARAFGDRAALALENARLYAEADRRRREAEVLADLLARISGSPDLDTILQRVAEGARELCRGDQAVIALRDVTTDAMVVRYWAGTQEAYSSVTIEPGKGSGGHVLLTRRPFRTASYAEDGRITKDYLDSVRANRVIAQLVVPILTEARVEGLIYAENRSPRAFTGVDEAILTRLAGHAAIAVGNARHRETLIQSEKLATMGQLLAGVAHELNNPLTVVLGRAAMLRELLADQPAAEHGQKISEAARRCGRIVKNFLALARHRPPERHVVSLNDIVTEAVELMAYPLRVDDVEVRLDLSQDLPQLWADPYQLHQVLVNLIANAHQAMRAAPPPRRLTLRSRHESTRQRVLLEAADTGPGIPREIEARIFEPFFTTKLEGQGTGLGLSLCKEMVEEHGGLIRVEGRRGQGAVFTVELPVRAPPATSDSARVRETRVPISGKTILVVDDEVEITGLLSEILSMHGCRVDTACSGIVALQKLEERRYDVILSDVRMPGMDGPALRRELGRRHPDLLSRLVFVTGDTLSPETQAMLKEAAAPSLSKPLHFPEVLEVIQQVLEGAAA